MCTEVDKTCIEDMKASIDAKRAMIKNLEERIQELMEENASLKLSGALFVYIVTCTCPSCCTFEPGLYNN